LGEVRNGVAQHFAQDAFNSVIVTTLADGTVPGRLSYRAFGQVRSLTGNVQSPFRFNGYISDGGDELSSPSRYYSVANGRFTSMDPAAPTQMNPLSWNAYVGLGANPMFNIDPDGRRECESMRCTLLMSQNFASREDRAKIDRQLALLTANQGKATRAEKYILGSILAVSDFATGFISAEVEADRIGMSAELTLEQKVDMSLQARGEINQALTHPYDTARMGTTNALTDIDALHEKGDDIGASRRLGGLALSYASAGLGMYGAAKAGVSSVSKIGAGVAQRAKIAAEVVVEGPGLSSARVAIDPWRTNKNQAFSGHGLWMDPHNETIVLGSGQYWVGPRPGNTIRDRAGVILEREGLAGLEKAAESATHPNVKKELMESLAVLELKGPGDQIKNFVLLPYDHPGTRRVSPPQPGAIGVESPTPLSRLLSNEPGCYVWSACTQMVDKNRPD